MKMTYGASRRSMLALTGFASMGLNSSIAFAQASKITRRAGVARFVVGDASISDASGKRTLIIGEVLREGHVIETGPASEAHIVFDDGGYLALRPNSRLQIDKVKIAGDFSDNLAMTLFAGAMRSITGWVGKFDRKNYQLSAVTATVGIRGTDHEVAIIADGEERKGEVSGVHNWVNEGGTTLKNAGGTIDVDASHAAWAGLKGQAPQAHIGIPGYLKQRRTKHEGRVDRHALHITEHIEARMQKRGLLKPGEKLEDAQQRHRSEKESELQRPEKAAEPSNQPKDASEKAAHVKRHARAR
jgi:hypothetical protein